MLSADGPLVARWSGPRHSLTNPYCRTSHLADSILEL